MACPKCKGDGTVDFNPDLRIPRDPQMDDYAPCDKCGGWGMVEER